MAARAHRSEMRAAKLRRREPGPVALDGGQAAVVVEETGIANMEALLDEANSALHRINTMLQTLCGDMARRNRALSAASRRLDRKIEENWRLLNELTGRAPDAR